MLSFQIMYQTFTINQYTGRPQIIGHDGEMSEAAIEDVPIRVHRRHPYKMASADLTSSVPVEVLGKKAYLSMPHIQMMITGTNT